METSGQRNNSPLKLLSRLSFVRDAALLTCFSAAFGLIANFVHPNSIPFIAEEEYEILVPCPEPGGEVTLIAPDDAILSVRDTFFVDARSEAQYRSWRFKNATNMTYDYLDPTPEEKIRGLAGQIARSRAKKVVVYGDGETPDTGEQLGRELSGHGIKNVHCVLGGAAALKGLHDKRGAM